MAFRNIIVLFIVSLILVHCESSLVYTLPKCRIWDNECQRNVMEILTHNVGDTGVPDLDAYQIDPLDITGVHIPVMDLIDLTMVKGEVRGIKKCIVTKFIVNFELGLISSDSICDISVENTSMFTVSSNNPFIKIFLGKDAIYGQGNGSITIEQLFFSFNYPFDLVTRNNDLFIKGQPDNASLIVEPLGKVKLHADKDGVNDLSNDILIGVINENWRLVFQFFWRVLKDVSTRYMYDFTTKYFDNVPLKYFISEEDFPRHIYG